MNEKQFNRICLIMVLTFVILLVNIFGYAIYEVMPTHTICEIEIERVLSYTSGGRLIIAHQSMMVCKSK